MKLVDDQSAIRVLQEKGITEGQRTVLVSTVWLWDSGGWKCGKVPHVHFLFPLFVDSGPTRKEVAAHFSFVLPYFFIEQTHET